MVLLPNSDFWLPPVQDVHSTGVVIRSEVSRPGRGWIPVQPVEEIIHETGGGGVRSKHIRVEMLEASRVFDISAGHQ